MTREYPYGIKLIAWISIIVDILGLIALLLIAGLIASGRIPDQSSLMYNGKPIHALQQFPAGLLIICLIMPFVAAILIVHISLLEAKVWAYYVSIVLLWINGLSQLYSMINGSRQGGIHIDFGLIFTALFIWVMFSNCQQFFDYAKHKGQNAEDASLV